MGRFPPGMGRRFVVGFVSVCAGLAIPVLLEPGCLWTPQVGCLVLLGVAANVFQPDYKPFEVSRNPEDRGTATQILWTVQLTQLAAFLEAVLLRWPESFQWDGFTTAALVLMVSGLCVRSWAVATLGRFFTWHVALQEDQRVIREGPYRFVRHPSYTGAFFTYVGTTVFLHSWYSAAAAAVLLPLAFYRRIHHEERRLRESLSDYEAYQREVPALLPRPF